LDWDTNSPAIARLLVVVSSTRQWLVMAAKDTETNCEAGDGSRGHCNVSGGVSCLSGCHSVFPSQVVSSVFRGRRRRMEMTKRRRFWRGRPFLNLVLEVSKIFIQAPDLLISNFNPLKLD
jgi:hypothetical protein